MQMQMQNPGLVDKLAYFNHDEDKTNYVKNNLASIPVLTHDELLKCLSKFYRDESRNNFVKCIENKVSEMDGEILLLCFKEFHRDDERNIFVGTIANKINLNFYQFVECLKNYCRDDTKDVFFGLMYSKVAITLENFTELMNCYTCEPKKLLQLIKEKKITFESEKIEKKEEKGPSLCCISADGDRNQEQKLSKLPLDTFVKNMKNINDNSKYQVLRCMYEFLEITNIESICEYFTDLDALKKTLILLKVEPSIQEEYINNRINALNDFWIFKYTHSYEKDGSSYDNFNGTKIDISKGINYNNTDENGRLVITGSNSSYDIKFYSSNGGTGSMNTDIRKKKIYLKNGQLRLYNYEKTSKVTLCDRGTW